MIRVCMIIGSLLAGALGAWAQSVEANRLPPTLLEQASEMVREPADRREEWETDRDSFTPAATTTGRGRAIVESAYSFQQLPGNSNTHSYPELLVRYGVSERIELRLGWNLESGGAATSISNGSSNEGLFEGDRTETSINYGVKVAVTESEGLIPRSALMIMAFTPTSGENTSTGLVVTGVMGWELPRGLTLDSAVRYAAQSEAHDHFSIWASSIVLKVPLGERWNAHIEYFSLFSDGKERAFVQHYISPGVHYLVRNNIEIGTRLGWGLNDQSSRFFVNTGAAVRF